MQYLLAVLTVFAVTRSAWADVAPEPLNPGGPTGALVWIAVAAAVGALALIWLRRRR
jgi:hypothetical protein